MLRVAELGSSLLCSTCYVTRRNHCAQTLRCFPRMIVVEAAQIGIRSIFYRIYIFHRVFTSPCLCSNTDRRVLCSIVSLIHHVFARVSQLVSWCFGPSQPQRIALDMVDQVQDQTRWTRVRVKHGGLWARWNTDTVEYNYRHGGTQKHASQKSVGLLCSSTYYVMLDTGWKKSALCYIFHGLKSVPCTHVTC